jgi:hypothetical protein
MKLKTALAPIVATLSLAFVASDASAYYAPHLGRWLTRDPIEYDGETANLYEYVGNSPINFVDAFGNKHGSPHPGPVRPRPKPDPIGTPLPSNSPECDEYSCTDSYRGALARCFCRCAGDSPWSNHVRGCLRELYEQGVPPAEAHERCYDNADGQNYPGGRPWLTLIHCYVRCTPLPLAL